MTVEAELDAKKEVEEQVLNKLKDVSYKQSLADLNRLLMLLNRMSDPPDIFTDIITQLEKAKDITALDKCAVLLNTKMAVCQNNIVLAAAKRVTENIRGNIALDKYKHDFFKITENEVYVP